MATAAIAGIGALGSLLSHLGGSSAKTDRQQTLESYGGLKDLMYHLKQMGYDTDALGMDESKEAFGDLQPAKGYYDKLLSGDRASTLQAVAPTITAAKAQEDAQKRQLATSGTARGGGVNATTQQLDTGTQSTIDNAITAVKPAAAAGSVNVANSEGNIGNSVLQHAMQLLGLSSEDATNLGSLSSKNRPVDYSIHNDTGSQIGQGVAGLLSAFGHLGDNNTPNDLGGLG